MIVRQKPPFRQEPLGHLRYRAGGVKAYVDGPSSRRKTMRTQIRLKLVQRFVTPLIAVDDGDIRYLVDVSDIGPITVGLVGKKRWDEPLMARTLELLASVTCAPDPLHGKVFLDVGANIGTASLCALKRFGAARAVAFEPEPKNFKFLKLNLILNDLEDCALPMQVAISDAGGLLSLEVSPENVGDHRIRTSGVVGLGQLGEGRRATVDVDALTLDDAVTRAGVAPADIGLIWVDVQGHEPHVLAGAAATLGAGAPVLVEYWPYGLRHAGVLDRMHEQLRAHFGTAWEVGEEREDGPPTPVDLTALTAFDERFTHPYDATNLLLLPHAA